MNNKCNDFVIEDVKFASSKPGFPYYCVIADLRDGNRIVIATLYGKTKEEAYKNAYITRKRLLRNGLKTPTREETTPVGELFIEQQKARVSNNYPNIFRQRILKQTTCGPIVEAVIYAPDASTLREKTRKYVDRSDLSITHTKFNHRDPAYFVFGGKIIKGRIIETIAKWNSYSMEPKICYQLDIGGVDEAECLEYELYKSKNDPELQRKISGV